MTVTDYFWDLAQKKIEREPEEYRTQFCDYGYYNNGCGWVSSGGEWEYDEEQAYNDAVDEMLENVYSENFDELGNFLSIPEVEADLKAMDGYDENLDFLFNDTAKNNLINLINHYAYGD